MHYRKRIAAILRTGGHALGAAAVVFRLGLACLLIVIAGTAPSLSSQQASPQIPADTLDVTNVVGTENQFAQIRDYIVFEDVIVLIDGTPVEGEKLVHLVDRRTGALLDRAASIGQGPGETTHPIALIQSPPSAHAPAPAVGVYDAAQNKIIQYEITGDRMVLVDETRVLGAPFREGAWIDEGRLVASRFGTDGLLVFYERHNETLRRRQLAAELLFEPADGELQLRVNETRLAVSPDGFQFALAFFLDSTIRLYDRDGALVRELTGPKDVKPPLPRIPGHADLWMFARMGMRVAYEAASFSSGHLIASFSGEPIENFLLRKGPPFATELHVFDRDGELKGVAKLPQELYRVKGMRGTEKIYGIRPDPYPAIVELGIPAFIQPAP